MSSNDSFNDTNDSFSTSEISLPRSVRFLLMLAFNIPSTICTIYLICHILTNRTHRLALHNHTILFILLFGLPIQLLDINFYLAFFHYGFVQPSTPALCRFWWFLDYGIYNGGLILTAWLAIERHILIFHEQRITNRRGRFVFHYLPLSVLIIYDLVFYIVVIYFLSCEDTYVYTTPVCGASPCYQSDDILGLWEFFVNTTAPILIEAIASVLLVFRVQWQKRRLRQSTQWRKYRRMILQLFFVSGLNIIFNLPISIVPLAHLCGLPEEYGIQVELYFFFLGYFVILLFPFATLCQFPEVRKKFINKIRGIISRRPISVQPIINMTVNMK